MQLTLYIWLVSLAAGSITILNYFFCDYGLLTLLWGLVNPICIIALDAIAAIIVHNLPRSWMNAYRKCFTVSRKELSLYRKTNIVVWKNYVPETGKATTGMSKSRIEGTRSDYLWLFLEETCYAEWVHYAMCLSGFLTLLYIPHNMWVTLALPQIIVNFILNLLPSFIQRNNRPKLLNMYEHAKSRDKTTVEA